MKNTHVPLIERIKLLVNFILYKKINFRKVLFIFFENSFTNFKFVQIGAFDGKSHDFLYDYVINTKLSTFGILVEPVPDYYEKLKLNYANIDGLNFENVAIHNDKCNVQLYKIKDNYEEQVPSYLLGCASIFENHFKTHSVNSAFVESIHVPALSLPKLMKKYDCFEYTLLQIDTEGYDGTIIQNLDLNYNKFHAIKYEHINLSKIEKSNTILYLKKHSYIVGQDKDDIIAIKISIFLKFLFSNK